MTTLAADRPLPAAARPGSALSQGFGDCRVLIGRTLRHIIRNPEQAFQVITLPVILLLLFRYLFGYAIGTGSLSYVNYLLAGLIVISVAFNSTSTAVGVASDLQNGIVERFRSMPMLSSAVLVGHVAAAVLRNAVSMVIMIGLGFAVGFRPEAGIGGWLGALGLLLLFTTAVSSLAVLLGVVAGSVEGASGFSMILVFVPYASSALIPTESMPSVLRAVVSNQPVSPMIDAVRSLFNGLPVGNTVWLALVWWVGILVLSAPLAVRMFRRRATR
jgi:ABC-2 type transport system permease protein